MNRWLPVFGLTTLLLGTPAVAEDVLLTLPNKFTVTCTQAHRVSTEGVRDGNRETLPQITNKNPLVFEFQHGSFSATHSSVEISEPSPPLKYRTDIKTTITGTLNRGVLTGEYTEFHAFSDCSDSTMPDGFLCHKYWVRGKVTGQADADGRLHVKITEWTYKVEQREYGTESHHQRQGLRIRQLSDWKDVSADLPQDDPHANTAIELPLQLPVGQTSAAAAK